MGLCYSLRPLLFGDPEDAPRVASQPPAEGARPTPTPAPAAGGDVARTALPRGAGGSPACARPKASPKTECRRPDQLRAEEREAHREARKVSRNIDRMLREQKRDLQQTHRLLLLGRCRRRPDRLVRASSGRDGGGEGGTGAASPALARSTALSRGPLLSPHRVGDARRRDTERFVSLKSCAE